MIRFLLFIWAFEGSFGYNCMEQDISADYNDRFQDLVGRISSADGGFVLPTLYLKHGERGVGVFNREFLPNNTLLMRIPVSLMLDKTSLNATDAAVVTRLMDTQTSDSSDAMFALLYAHICNDVNAGSFHEIHPGCVFLGSRCVGDADLHPVLERMFPPGSFEPHVYSLDQERSWYEWALEQLPEESAATTVSMQQFLHMRCHLGRSYETTDNLLDRHGDAVIIPGADLLNHSPYNNAYFEIVEEDGRMFCLVKTLVPVAANKELCTSYRAKCCTPIEMLASYGFYEPGEGPLCFAIYVEGHLLNYSFNYHYKDLEEEDVGRLCREELLKYPRVSFDAFSPHPILARYYSQSRRFLERCVSKHSREKEDVRKEL